MAAKSAASVGRLFIGSFLLLATCCPPYAAPWADDVRLSDLEPKFTCKACGRRGADVRPLFERARMGA